MYLVKESETANTCFQELYHRPHIYPPLAIISNTRQNPSTSPNLDTTLRYNTKEKTLTPHVTSMASYPPHPQPVPHSQSFSYSSSPSYPHQIPQQQQQQFPPHPPRGPSHSQSYTNGFNNLAPPSQPQSQYAKPQEYYQQGRRHSSNASIHPPMPQSYPPNSYPPPPQHRRHSSSASPYSTSASMQIHRHPSQSYQQPQYGLALPHPGYERQGSHHSHHSHHAYDDPYGNDDAIAEESSADSDSEWERERKRKSARDHRPSFGDTLSLVWRSASGAFSRRNV